MLVIFTSIIQSSHNHTKWKHWKNKESRGEENRSTDNISRTKKKVNLNDACPKVYFNLCIKMSFSIILLIYFWRRKRGREGGKEEGRKWGGKWNKRGGRETKHSPAVAEKGDEKGRGRGNKGKVKKEKLDILPIKINCQINSKTNFKAGPFKENCKHKKHIR